MENDYDPEKTAERLLAAMARTMSHAERVGILAAHLALYQSHGELVGIATCKKVVLDVISGDTTGPRQ